MVEGANSRLKAALLCFTRLSPLASHSCGHIWQSCCSRTCKPAPKFSHLVTTRTGREFPRQFVSTRVSQSRTLSGTVGEAATGTGGTRHTQKWHRLHRKQPSALHNTVEYVYSFRNIYIHTFTYMLSYTSYICMGVCIGTHDGSPKFSVKKECIVCVCAKRSQLLQTVYQLKWEFYSPPHPYFGIFQWFIQFGKSLILTY